MKDMKLKKLNVSTEMAAYNAGWYGSSKTSTGVELLNSGQSATNTINNSKNRGGGKRENKAGKG